MDLAQFLGEVQTAAARAEAEGSGTVYVGGVWVCGGVARVTDPCYGRDTRPGIWGTVPALPGEWRAAVDTDDGLVARLVTWAEVTGEPGDDTNWEELPFSAAVDSGTCGVFDEARYFKNPPRCNARYAWRVGGRDAEDRGSWDDLGVVSSSGHGDGVYPVYARRGADGLADAILVAFIADDSDDDGEDSGEDCDDGEDLDDIDDSAQ